MRMRRKDERHTGAALIEMAVVLPVLLMMSLGLIESARLGMVAQLMNNAAREGCRVAAMQGKTQADVQARITAVMSGSGITGTMLSVTPSNWANSAGGTPITVNISIPYSRVNWLGETLYLGNVSVAASATLCSERP